MWTIIGETVALTLLTFYSLAIATMFRMVRIEGRGLRQREVGTLLSILGAGLCLLWAVWGCPTPFIWMPVSLSGYYLIYRADPLGWHRDCKRMFMIRFRHEKPAQ